MHPKSLISDQKICISEIIAKEVLNVNDISKHAKKRAAKNNEYCVIEGEITDNWNNAIVILLLKK